MQVAIGPRKIQGQTPAPKRRHQEREEISVIELTRIRELKFDWGRSDLNQDHVYANQAFTHKLNEFGIPHEAEEYNGTWGDKTWGDDGRIYSEVLPFFKKHLVFDRQP